MIYRLIDSQTLDWFGKDNKSSTIEYFLGLFVASAFFGSCVILILFPILKFLGLIKYDKWKRANKIGGKKIIDGIKMKTSNLS